MGRPFGGLELRVIVLGKVAQRLPRPVVLRSAARRLTQGERLHSSDGNRPGATDMGAKQQ